MKHASQHDFGRAMPLVHSDSDLPCDKWEALSYLTDAAQAYDLSHRTLGVLRALLSFLPGRVISPVQGQAVVFPSNKTLGTRMNGMPESTLRRHLAALVSAGIVSRQDSPNRKRFARRLGFGVDVAFGFDLSPLAREWSSLRTTALEMTRQRERLAAKRARLAALRQELVTHHGPCPLADDTFKALRRRPDDAVFERLTHEIETRLATQEMSATDVQNERHIHKEIINNSDTHPRDSKHAEGHALHQIILDCKEYKSYFPTPLSHWHDIISLAGKLAPMLGIDRAVLDEAMRFMGLKQAAVAIFVILEKLGTIQNPGGYLRRLTQSARAGQFSAERLRASLCHGG